MQPGDVLSTAAQLAVALAGFAGIIVTFRPRSVHEWEPVDKFRLRLLLANSILALIYSLFAMLLLSIELPATWIWRAGSACALFFDVPFAITTIKGARSLPQYRDQGLTHVIYTTFALLGIGSTLLQAVNLVYLNVFWILFVTIFVHLVAAAFQFVRMIISGYDRPSDQ